MLHIRKLDPHRLQEAARYAGANAAEIEAGKGQAPLEPDITEELEGAHLICRTMAADLAADHTERDLSARLCWTATDSFYARRREIRQAQDDVREQVRPLLYARAPKAQIEERAAYAAGDRLPWALIVPVLRQEAGRVLAGRRR